MVYGLQEIQRAAEVSMAIEAEAVRSMNLRRSCGRMLPVNARQAGQERAARVHLAQIAEEVSRPFRAAHPNPLISRAALWRAGRVQNAVTPRHTNVTKCHSHRCDIACFVHKLILWAELDLELKSNVTVFRFL
jgi:hypothetical protein